MTRLHESRTLRALLADPFGPYVDSDILSDKCKTTQSQVLRLNGLIFECEGKATGLTEFEPDQPESRNHPANRRRAEIRFRGILQIDKLAWLTPRGREALQKDLRKRAVARSQAGNRLGITSSLQLESLYSGAGDLRVKVWVQATKALTAQYLTSKYALDGLMLFSKDRNRSYQIVSMLPEIYEMSRKFLSRYEALNFLKEMVALDKKMQTSKNQSVTATPQRTPDWFVRLYRSYLANEINVRTRRIIPPDSDSDTMLGGEGKLRRPRKRTLPHISTAELMSLIASHAEWLVANQTKRRRDRYIDVDVWKEWLAVVKRTRQEAAQYGVTWGLFDPEEDVAADNGSDYDSDQERASVPRRRSSRRKQQAGSATGPAPKNATRTRSSLFAPMSRPAQIPSDDDYEAGHIFDPDFSPPSTSDASFSDSLPSRSSTPTDPALLGQYPTALMQPPALPASFIWACPLHLCTYRLDLTNPSNENLRGLLPHDKQRLVAGGWKLSDSWVDDCFLRMVSLHYEKHEEEMGIRTTWQGNQPKLEWKDPRNH
ncbi:hypothetical protein CERSUDRAFT_120898, partial [Gelatoporia subvermispora B]